MTAPQVREVMEALVRHLWLEVKVWIWAISR